MEVKRVGGGPERGGGGGLETDMQCGRGGREMIGRGRGRALTQIVQ